MTLPQPGQFVSLILQPDVTLLTVNGIKYKMDVTIIVS